MHCKYLVRHAITSTCINFEIQDKSFDVLIHAKDCIIVYFIYRSDSIHARDMSILEAQIAVKVRSVLFILCDNKSLQNIKVCQKGCTTVKKF